MASSLRSLDEKKTGKDDKPVVPVFNSRWCDKSFTKEAEFYPVVIQANVVDPLGGYLMGNRSFHLSVVSLMSLVVSFIKRNEGATSWE